MIHTRTSAAKTLGVHPNTIRRWEDLGVIPEPQRDAANRRVYSDAEMLKLKQIADERREANEKRLSGE